MTTFKDAEDGYRAVIEKHYSGEMIRIYVSDGEEEGIACHLNPADDSAIALAVMEAAQLEKQDSDPASADYARHEAVNWLMTARDRAAKEAAADAEEAARDKRRDELAREFDDSCNAGYAEYDVMPLVVRRAIDRIIDTENELAKERAK